MQVMVVLGNVHGWPWRVPRNHLFKCMLVQVLVCVLGSGSTGAYGIITVIK